MPTFPTEAEAQRDLLLAPYRQVAAELGLRLADQQTVEGADGQFTLCDRYVSAEGTILEFLVVINEGALARSAPGFHGAFIRTYFEDNGVLRMELSSAEPEPPPRAVGLISRLSQWFVHHLPNPSRVPPLTRPSDLAAAYAEHRRRFQARGAGALQPGSDVRAFMEKCEQRFEHEYDDDGCVRADR